LNQNHVKSIQAYIAQDTLSLSELFTLIQEQVFKNIVVNFLKEELVKEILFLSFNF
jgi:hypothetical protein